MSSPIEPAPGRHGQGAGQRGPRISRRVAAIAESATLAIDARAKALKAMGEDVIAFGAGEPDFPTPAHVVEAAAAATHQPRFHHYTPTAGLPELREAVAAKRARPAGCRGAARPRDRRRRGDPVGPRPPRAARAGPRSGCSGGSAAGGWRARGRWRRRWPRVWRCRPRPGAFSRT